MTQLGRREGCLELQVEVASGFQWLRFTTGTSLGIIMEMPVPTPHWLHQIKLGEAHFGVPLPQFKAQAARRFTWLAQLESEGLRLP